MDEKHGGGLADALRMLEVFSSVGVTAFDITHTNIDGEKRGFRPRQSLAETRRSMPFLVPSAARRQNNLIVRPHAPPPVFLIQLDDLNEPATRRVSAASFLVLATSPGNFQAWLAVQGSQDADLVRRVRKAAGADPTASGATRVAGTANFKRKYEPDFPTVAIAAAQEGRTVTVAELDALGLVAPPERAAKPLPLSAGVTALPATKRARGVWPNYQHTLARAPLAHNSDRPDISRADYTWCMTAIDWGWSIEATAAKLIEESPKAREAGQNYALLTARNAAAAVERRRGSSHSPSM